MPHYALTLLLPLLFLTGVAHAAPEQALGREQALQSLAHADVQVRRMAASRLGEVGLMEDTPALLRALRDDDELARANAEQAMWQIWGRSGDPQIDELYRSGVEQMSKGELPQGIATFTRIIRLKPGFAEGWNKRATLFFLSLRRARRLRPDLSQARGLHAIPRIFPPRARPQPHHGQRPAEYPSARTADRAETQRNDLTPGKLGKKSPRRVRRRVRRRAVRRKARARPPPRPAGARTETGGRPRCA
jgi:hypothetical protein